MVPVLQVRPGKVRQDTFRLRLRPSVPELLVRYGLRVGLGWWRELAMVVGLLVVVGSGGRWLLGMAVVVVAVVPALRRRAVGWLAVGRLRRRWAAACRACGLEDGKRSPGIRRVRRVPAGWAFRVRLRPGQEVADLQNAAWKLAGALQCRELRIAPDLTHAGRADLVAVGREALGLPVPVSELDPAGTDTVDLNAVQVGRREDGGPWLLPIRGGHVLVAGATGAGKGSVLWSIIRGLGPAVRAGLVQVWACDPKGGMELAFGEPLYERFATTIDDIAELLEDGVRVMNRRTGWLRGRSRLHTPTSKHPLIVIVVDEIAALTAYAADRELRNKIAGALSLLLSQGRAPGVVVVGAVQDPRKDVLPFRDLFPLRVLLRVTNAGTVDLVLGEGAYQRGAWADRIPIGLPGVGYVLADGDPTPVRVRASWVDDDQIHRTAAAYGRAPDWAAPAWADLPGGAPGRALPTLARPALTGPPQPVPGPPTSGPPVPGPAVSRPAASTPAAGGWVPTIPPDGVDDPTIPLRAWTPPPPAALPAAPPVPPLAADDGGPAGEALWERFARGQSRRRPPDPA